MKTAQQVADMITAIRCTQGGVDFLAGSESVEQAAQEWIDAGFTAGSAADWWEAGCFDADRTAELRDAGLTPDQAGQRHDDLSDVGARSIGYAYCNLDISLHRAEEMING